MARRKPSLGGVNASRPDTDYQTEDDFRTLERSEEVRGDPARHKRAVGFGRKRVSAIQRVIGGPPKGKSRGRATMRTRSSGR